jgi:ribosome maturation factor RimP
MASGPGATLKAGLEQPLSQLGVDVEAVEVAKAGRRHVVRIVVDRDGGVDLDLVAEVSRRASELLDAEPLSQAIDGAYVLEVTSPGVDRPLTEPRHWRRAVGRLVEVRLADGSVLTGRVSGADDVNAQLATDAGERAVAYADVQRAVVQIEFNRPDAAGDAAHPDTADDETQE